MSEVNELTAGSDVTSIKHIGDSRASGLGIERVEELAQMTSEEVLEELEHVTKEQAVSAVKQARKIVDVNPYEVVEATPVEVDEFDDADEFVEASGASGQQEYSALGIIAGDDAYDNHVVEAEPDQKIAGEVAQRMVEEGLNEPETVVAMESSMGRVAVNEWARYTAQETDIELPELKQVGVNRENVESDDWKDIYAERDERFLDECDAILVVRNGDFVGKFVNLVADRPDDDVFIRTPDYEGDNDDDEIPEFEDA